VRPKAYGSHDESRQQGPHVASDPNHFVHGFDPAIAGFHGAALLFEDFVGIAGNAGVEHDQPRVEIAHLLARERHRFDKHRIVGLEADEIETAKGRRVLVLLADRTADLVDFDGARLARQRGFGAMDAQIGVHALQQRHGKTAGRSEAGAAGDVGGAGQLDARQVEAIEDTPKDGVLDTLGGIDVLGARIL